MENIDTKSILIEELEKELNIVRENLIKLSDETEEYKKQLLNETDEKLRETREYYQNIIEKLDEEKQEIARKLEAIECSRSYKITKKIKRILGGKNE